MLKLDEVCECLHLLKMSRTVCVNDQAQGVWSSVYAHLDVHDGAEAFDFIHKPQIDKRSRLKEHRLETLLCLLERC